MRVLIACEFSGVVRNAFAAKGHEAFSCDLLESEDRNKDRHIIGDCLTILDRKWDLMIAHPPCTYLCNSGVRWLYGGRGSVRDEKRWQLMEQAAEFFYKLLTAPVRRVCIENPIMHRYALEHMAKLNKSSVKEIRHTQIIQPYEHGHGETKATALWLSDLPLLKPSNLVEGRTPRVHFASPGKNRWKERSRTLPGIAKAMAEQWG